MGGDRDQTKRLMGPKPGEQRTGYFPSDNPRSEIPADLRYGSSLTQRQEIYLICDRRESIRPRELASAGRHFLSLEGSENTGKKGQHPSMIKSFDGTVVCWKILMLYQLQTG